MLKTMKVVMMTMVMVVMVEVLISQWQLLRP